MSKQTKKGCIFTYRVGDGLYVNLTNRCPNACEFCVRTVKEDYYAEDGLWLLREPEAEEVLAQAEKELSAVKELVFCGFGEPTERLDTLLAVAKGVKQAAPSLPIRLNTNGLGNLLNGKDILPSLEHLIDTVSISLNAPTPEKYQKLCHCRYGEKGFFAMLDFTERARAYIPRVVLSVVDLLPPEEIAQCRAIAEKLGVELRVREMIR